MVLFARMLRVELDSTVIPWLVLVPFVWMVLPVTFVPVVANNWIPYAEFVEPFA